MFSPSFPSELVMQSSKESGNDIIENALVFTRIPKSGTANWVTLLKGLSRFNEFKHSRLPHRMRIKSADEQVG